MDKEMRMRRLISKLRLRPEAAVERAMLITELRPDDPMSAMMLMNPDHKTAYHLILRHSPPLAAEYWDINAPTDFLKHKRDNEQSSNTTKSIRPVKDAGTERHNKQRPSKDWPPGKIDRSGGR